MKLGIRIVADHAEDMAVVLREIAADINQRKADSNGTFNLAGAKVDFEFTDSDELFEISPDEKVVEPKYLNK